MLEDLLEFVKANSRVCPQPRRWQELWEMLPDRNATGAGLSPPLILAAWWHTPALLKILRLQEHLRYADAHGVLADVDRFLRALPEEEWAHLGEA